MSPLNRLHDPSLRLLLWIEWILLGLTAVEEIRQQYQLFDERSPLLSLTCITLIALLGLRIPQDSTPAKLSYTAINLSLLLLAALVGHIQYFFLICIVLIMRGYFLFNRRGRWWVLAGMSTVFLLVQFYRVRTFSSFTQIAPPATEESLQPFFIGSVVLFFLVLAFLHLMMNALLSERSSRQQLAIANDQLRRYALQIEETATLQERTRIAREIHDALGHSLTALNLSINAALGLWTQDLSEAKDLLTEAQVLSKSALKDVRQAVTTLRSDPLSEYSLATLMQELAIKLQQSTGIHPHIVLQLSQPVSEVHKAVMYRIVQEALTNITKHAQATAVEISIENTDSNLLSVVIQDNGQGFARNQTTSGFGLRGIEERVLALRGTLDIITQPAQGCCITVRLPLHPQ